MAPLLLFLVSFTELCIISVVHCMARCVLSYNNEFCDDKFWFSKGKIVALLGCCIIGGIGWVAEFYNINSVGGVLSVMIVFYEKHE